MKKYSSVPHSVLLFMARRNLVTKKFRSSLTIAGVAIGVGSIFFLLSFGLGLRIFVTDQLIGNKSIKLVDVTSQNSKILKLDNENIEKLAGLPKISKLGKSYSMAGKMLYEKSQVNIIAYGVDPNYQDLSYLSMLSGEKLDDDYDLDNILISKTAMEDIGFDKAKDAIGQEVSISIPIIDGKQTFEGDFKIRGVVDSEYGSEIFILKDAFNEYIIEQYSQIKISVNEVGDLPNLRKQIESMGYNTSSPVDTIEQVNQIFGYFNIALICLGSIGMVIAILGMLNTLSVSLIEKTSEIGLLMSLGGRRKDMKKLFVYEALQLSFIGAAIGMGVSLIVCIVINSIINRTVLSRGFSEAINLFYTPTWLFFGLLGLMLLIGLIVSQMPARRAAKINPIDAMRQL